MQPDRDAVVFYRQAHEAQPECADYARCVAVMLLNMGRHEEALEAYLRVRTIDPTFMTASVLNEIGFLSNALKGWKEALHYYRQAHEAEPGNPMYARNTGLAYKNTGDYQKAIEFFRKTKELDPDYFAADTENQFGSCQAEIGNWDEALNHYRKAYELDTKEPAYTYNVGMAYRQIENCADALIFFQKTIEQDPSFSPAAVQNNIGLCWEQTGGWGEAQLHYLKAHELDPKDPAYSRNVGISHMRNGRLKEAVEFFSKTRSLDPDYMASNIEELIQDCERKLAEE
ncbi:MAG: tetratricopeptide repeat protein [Pseudomonadota bacterium]